MPIITRPEWGARHGDGVGSAWPVADRLYLHHSVTVAPDVVPPFDDDYAAIRAIENIGAQRFGVAYGFPYSFAITPAGLTFAGHNLRKNGAHTGGLNSRARGIVLVGNYSAARPTDAMLDAVAALVRHGYGMNWWSVQRLTGGHRDVKATECPGNHAYALLGDISGRIEGKVGAPPTPSPAPPSRPERMPWPAWMPSGHYFGLKSGPARSHGGYFARERPYVRVIQQWLIARGYVPGVTNIHSGWADGVFEQPTFDAVAAFQRREMPGTQFYGQVWADDWRRLVA